MSRNKAFKKGQRNLVATPAVDVTAVKFYWNSLDVDEKLRVLRFEDLALVERVGNVQRDLVYSDSMCYTLGLRGQDVVRQEVGMNQFAMECAAGVLIPVAFFAKDEFVRRADFFENIESRLGSCFLKGRSVVQRDRWPSILEPRASSWSSFMSQVLKLVELAIYEAHCDSLASAESAACAVEAESNEQPPQWISSESEAVEPVNKTAKRRKARKKRGKAAAAATAAEEEPDDQDSAVSLHKEVQVSEDDGNRAAAAFSKLSLTESLLRPMEARSDSGDDSVAAAVCKSCSRRSSSSDDRGAATAAAASKSRSNSSDTNGAAAACSVHRQRSRSNSTQRSRSKKPQGDSCLNFDWSPEGPPIDAAEDAASVELEVDWSVGFNRHPMQTRWSAWLSNGLTGNAAEWHWEVSGVPTVAFLKNTFLEIKDNFPEEQHVRPRSLPARLRPAEGWSSMPCPAEAA